MMATDPSPALLFPIPPSFTTLPSSSPSKIAYIFSPAAKSSSTIYGNVSPVLLVFLSGLQTPMAVWHRSLRTLMNMSLPGVSMLAYDRFGIGMTTDNHPKDAIASDPAHGHDLDDAATDLRELISYILSHHMGRAVDFSDPTHSLLETIPQIILVGSSLGCQLSQLFTYRNPGLVSGLLFLDPSPQPLKGSFVSQLPDFNAPGFSDEVLAKGITINDLKKCSQLLDTSSGSGEGLTLQNLQAILPPHTNGFHHKLVGRPSMSPSSINAKADTSPILTLLTHDPEKFALELKQRMEISHIVTMTYLQPFCQQCNDELCSITDEEFVRGPTAVKGAGHYIMIDQPDVVTYEIGKILDRVRSRYNPIISPG